MSSMFPEVDDILAPSLGGKGRASAPSMFPETDAVLAPSLKAGKGPIKGDQPIADWDVWHQLLDGAVFGKYSDSSKERAAAKADWEKENPKKAALGEGLGRALPMTAIGVIASAALPEVATATALGTAARFLVGNVGRSLATRAASMAAAGGWQGALGAEINNALGARPKEDPVGGAAAGGVGGVLGSVVGNPLRSAVAPGVAKIARAFQGAGGYLTPAQVPGAPSAIRGVAAVSRLGKDDLPKLTKSLMGATGDENAEFTTSGISKRLGEIQQELQAARASGDLAGVRAAQNQQHVATILRSVANIGGDTGEVVPAALQKQMMAARGAGQVPQQLNALTVGADKFMRAKGQPWSMSDWANLSVPGILGAEVMPGIGHVIEQLPGGMGTAAAIGGGAGAVGYGAAGALMNNPFYLRAMLSGRLPVINPLVSPAQETMGNSMGRRLGSPMSSAHAEGADQSGWEDYIRAAAQKRGINPDIAVRVARTEGLGDTYAGDEGSSFGPYQLHYGGMAKGGNAVSGLGDVFTKATGLHARDPGTVPQQIDFALDYARANGWGPWHGWKGDEFEGIPKGLQVRAGPTSSGLTSALQPITGPGPSQDEIANALGGGGQ
jgi:hypothetical protein